ncbi:secreted RxLR effector protein 161-like [Nicotiana tomentosiformis]|uniref:secreted RxLR effector protein 161-like n=1 Tax=Nicotiana tomentosiformis TaxID=4098 RepID=UPI00388C75BE
MEDSEEIGTLIATTTKLDIDQHGSSVYQKLYRGMIGSLLYLTASKPNIVFSVGLCARFQANPKESHFTVVNRILRYLEGTTYLYIWYPKGSNFNLVGYADNDYAGFLLDRKRTSEQVKSGPKVTSEVTSEVTANLETRFVLVGNVVGVETADSA